MAFSEINQRIADERRHNENRARLAFASARVSTQGMGTYEFEDRIDFGLTFIERPAISIGHQIDIDQFRDTSGLEPGDNVSLPLCTGYVVDWDQTDRDHYVGCWVAIVVAPSVPVEIFPQFRSWHDFTFSAIALKDLPDEDRLLGLSPEV